MRRTLLGVCLVLGLASICVGSAWLGSRLALDHLAARGTLPVDLRSELEANYRGEEAPSYLPALEPGVSEQAREDEAQLAIQFSWADLEFVPVFSSQPDWQAVPTPIQLSTPAATGPAEEAPGDSTPTPSPESTAEPSPQPGSARNSFVVPFGPYPDADTYIVEEDQNTNYAVADEMHVSNMIGGRERVLIAISLAGLMRSGTLEHAFLHIYMASSVGTGGPVTVNRVTAPWDPSTATWESVLGGQFEAAATTSIDTKNTGWKVLDITPLMREWVEGSSKNYGVVLTAPAAGGDVTATFYGGNYPDPLLRPWLEVSFIGPGGS
jgi:hypothetical protein